MILEAVVVCEGKVYGEKDSLSLSPPPLRFNSHFPGEPGSAGVY